MKTRKAIPFEKGKNDRWSRMQKLQQRSEQVIKIKSIWKCHWARYSMARRSRNDCGRTYQRTYIVKTNWLCGKISKLCTLNSGGLSPMWLDTLIGSQWNTQVKYSKCFITDNWQINNQWYSRQDGM